MSPGKLIAVACFVLLTGQSVGAENAFPRYVGRDACLECHQVSAAPCSVEDMPAHDRSYAALQKPEARHIAAISGIAGDPAESLICLSCHATGADEGQRWTMAPFDMAHGVQCEACHGPGSLHLKTKDSVTIRLGDRDDCVTCHVERPSHTRVLKDGFRLSSDDAGYKTPVNLSVSPDGKTLFVACEHSDSVMVVDTASRTVTGEIGVGARPHDVTCSPDGKSVYVSNRMDSTVSVVSTDSLEVRETISVGHEPHAVVVEPVSNRLIVLNTADNTVTLRPLAGQGPTRVLSGGQGPWAATLDASGDRTIITSVRPDVGRFRDPPRSEITVIDNQSGRVEARVGVDGANMLQGIAHVPGTGVTLFTLMRSKNLIPISRLAQGWVITNGLGVLWPSGRVDQVLLDSPAHSFSDPMDIAVSPDGKRAVVVSGGGNEVAIIDVGALLTLLRESTERVRREVLPNHLGMTDRFVLRRVSVGRNPRGAVYSPDGKHVYIANALDDSISVLDTRAYDVVATVDLGGPQHVSHLRQGERIFHDASVAFGDQFSCRSCHPDGHINGLTFDIEADGIGLFPVDNRTLRGILDTPPFKWEGTNPTLGRQCGPRLSVFLTRLDPYTPEELSALVDYMCVIESPPNRFRKPDGLTLSQRRGKAVFERERFNNGSSIEPERRCVTCHSGAYLTTRSQTAVSTSMWFDGHTGVDMKEMFNARDYGELGTFYFVDVGLEDRELDIPHLRNIADSPPYMHNGAAKTLEEIWTRFNMTDRHGAAADLTRQQLNDLIAYLKAL
jgi:YVTN family beta-propeller protein